MRDLILKLSNLESIKITTGNNIDFENLDFGCSEIRAFFIDLKSLRIGQDSIGEFFEHFITKLKKCLNFELQLHESLVQNLGFMVNEHSCKNAHSKCDFVMTTSASGENTYWIGYKYEVWTTYAYADPYVYTWMYNDKNGNIIFEVTPFYKWSMQEREPEDLDFITYEEFMKNYKPLIHRVIPRDIAIEWLNESMKIYRSLFSSEENYKKACGRLNW